MKHLSFIYSLCLILISSSSCKKSEFLNTKPDQALVVPTTLADFQAILDNTDIMNGTVSVGDGQGLVPQAGETSSDNYYIYDANYNTSLTLQNRNFYVWAQSIYTGDPVFDWNIPYRSVFYSNIVLDGLAKITVGSDELTTYNNIKGSALFYRAHCFYQLAQIFAPPFNRNSASTDWGIPLRLHSDVGEQIQRSTLGETYDKIISDLIEAKSFLPNLPLYKTRPSKASVFALLARTYQTMEDYDKSFLYADSCLQIQSTIMDYNDANLVLPNTNFPFKRFNPEVIFHCNMLGTSVGIFPIRPTINKVDSLLYNSYSSDDWRKTAFFKTIGGGLTFLGSYNGTGTALFAGLTTAEMYLIRAEMYARKGDKSSSMKDLNDLLRSRWKKIPASPTGVTTYVDQVAVDATDALNKILIERRKELCFRALRWTDLRRLNKGGANITLTRKVNGQMYTLPPNDNRYTYPIPPTVISFNPGMFQNPR